MAGEKWKIGGVTVTRIVEIEMSGGLSRFLPDATREALPARLAPPSRRALPAGRA